MRLSDFEDKINPIIVDRGISYYERGLVKEVSQKGDEFIVVVEGTDAYQVFVDSIIKEPFSFLTVTVLMTRDQFVNIK